MEEEGRREEDASEESQNVIGGIRLVKGRVFLTLGFSLRRRRHESGPPRADHGRSAPGFNHSLPIPSPGGTQSGNCVYPLEVSGR